MAVSRVSPTSGKVAEVTMICPDKDREKSREAK